MPDEPTDGDARAKWVERVLGVKVPGRTAAAGAASASGWAAARQGWQAASEAVDRQIASLQAVLRQTGDDSLEEIAEFGMNSLTGDHKVPLMALLHALGDGDPSKLRKAEPKALALIDAFRKHLESSEKVEVCDGNPFGVPLAIRATLVPALARLAAALQAGAAP